MKIEATAAELRALLVFASTDPARINLHCIGASEGRLAATNGHAMAVLGKNPERPWSDSVVLPITAVRAVSVPILDDDEEGDEYEVDAEVEITIDASGFTMRRGDMTVSGALGTAKFPPVHEVIRARTKPAEKAERIGFDAALFAKLCEINKCFDHKVTWVMSPAGDKDPVVFTDHHDDHRWTILAMPMNLR